jgi:hypothetical protein
MLVAGGDSYLVSNALTQDECCLIILRFTPAIVNFLLHSAPYSLKLYLLSLKGDGHDAHSDVPAILTHPASSLSKPAPVVRIPPSPSEEEIEIRLWL